MRLQDQARLTGGKVLALLGNHEIMILSAQRFSQRLTDGPGGSFLDDWLYNGGQIADLQRLTEAHIAWLSNLPALLVVEEHLLLHSDAVFYQQYGASAAEVNAVFRAGMHSQQTSFFEQVLKNFGERGAFLDGQLGKARCWQMLDQFGGKRIVHGHTPIAKVLGIDPIHLGIIMVVNMEIGMIHPPVGLNLFVASHLARMGLTEVSIATLPWVGVMLLYLGLITYVPEISLWLPNLLYR